MAQNTVAEAFHPGEFIQEELEARGWSHADLANIMGRPARLIDEIIAGKRGLSADIASELGDAFGTGADFWLNLERAYRRHTPMRTDSHGSRPQEQRRAV